MRNVIELWSSLIIYGVLSLEINVVVSGGAESNNFYLPSGMFSKLKSTIMSENRNLFPKDLKREILSNIIY